MSSLNVLVIDDEPAVRQVLAATVAKGGYCVSQAATAAEAAARLARGDVDVALCDISLPDGNGIDLMRNSHASGLDTAIVVVTALASFDTAVEALRAGAFDYMPKPVRNEEVLHRLSQIAAVRGLRDENKALRQAVRECSPKLYRFTSPPMLEIERLVSRVAPTDSTVLITGESGTGKGVIARSIHEQSARCNGPFVHVNCSAIPEQLLESEFFGHTRGAFTGADRARKGLFLEADGGTLFLDEIGELPLHMQTKLLNAIEDKVIRALGSDQMRRVDTRIIAATNRDLAETVREGTFRQDLYYRLGMFHIAVSPLRERPADIQGLIAFLVKTARRKPGAPDLEIDALAEDALLSYGWPGNVRELENVINRTAILADNPRITIADLPPQVTSAVSMGAGNGHAGASVNLRDRMRRYETNVILQAVDHAKGDRRLAAQNLGISLSSLYRKLEELDCVP